MWISSSFGTFSVLQAEGKPPFLCVIQMFTCWHSSEPGALWQSEFSAIRAVSWKLLGSADLSAIRSVLLGIGCFLITSFKDSLGLSVPHWSQACRYLQTSEVREDFTALSMSSFVQQALLNPQLHWGLCFFGISIRFTWSFSICTFLIDNFSMSCITSAVGKEVFSFLWFLFLTLKVIPF